jgi:hypothetical protein
MAFLTLSRTGFENGATFDPERVLEEVRRRFPGLEQLPGDQLADRVRRAETQFASQLAADPNAATTRVVASLRRQAEQYAPAYAFLIPLANRNPVRGVARRDYIQLIFDDDLLAETRKQLMTLLRSLGPGRLTASNPDGQGELIGEITENEVGRRNES